MDWSNPVGSAVSGGFGIVGSLINYGLQKKLMAQQNEYSLNMWNLQNDYNSPAAQMKRYEEAGLNPALMYGQVTSGNASTAPQMHVPNAPDISGDMKDLAQAFNIEGLRTAIANRKKAQEEARLARANADDAQSTNDALANLGQNFMFDPKTGQFKPRVGHEWNGTVFGPSLADGKLMRSLAENYRTNSLLVPRANLIGTQAALNTGRHTLIAPQRSMLDYQAKYYKWPFWIGNVKNGVQAGATLGSFFY